MDARAGSAVSRKSEKASLILVIETPRGQRERRADLQMISTVSEGEGW